MKKLGLLLISSAFLFVGCGTKNEVAKQKSATTESSITTTISDSTKPSVSNKGEISSSESAVATSNSSGDNETTRSESTTASLSTPSASTEIPSTIQASTETSTVTNEFPYAVDPGRFNTPTTFQFKGMNVPASVTLENNNGQVTMTSTPKSGGEATVYTASIETIPTTSIRIFSYTGNAVRTVKVNTKINLLSKISSGNTPDQSDPFYVFENSSGGLSLITPNHAGNIYVDQTDIMLEAVH